MNTLREMETKSNFNVVRQDWDGYQSWFISFVNGLASCRLCIYSGTPKEAVVSDLFVHENCRKQGLGTDMLKYCETLAKEQGCYSISLQSDNDDWVREWYKRLGFEVESSLVWLKKNI